eukprot:CAMPEP_0183331656 /NCGR_PEP_ID=MMETSP0164_2-20130417/991_1 /TAXON_ID=221442 /ORGANISM="Coccolithus pelagicus ssp braarudi, Strain PLY182g" /LENGTH=120 /DNA_ID=CAMNT_0025500201 /DNA_START=375 /DNA_END=737 /DNA_ORIENTATION=-
MTEGEALSGSLAACTVVQYFSYLHTRWSRVECRTHLLFASGALSGHVRRGAVVGSSLSLVEQTSCLPHAGQQSYRKLSSGQESPLASSGTKSFADTHTADTKSSKPASTTTKASLIFPQG